MFSGDKKYVFLKISINVTLYLIWTYVDIRMSNWNPAQFLSLFSDLSTMYIQIKFDIFTSFISAHIPALLHFEVKDVLGQKK